MIDKRNKIICDRKCVEHSRFSPIRIIKNIIDECYNNNIDGIIGQLICPLTNEIFNDPVVTNDGSVYERTKILEWFSKNRTSPITRERISSRVYNISMITNIIKYCSNKCNQIKHDIYRLSQNELINKVNSSSCYDELLNYASLESRLWLNYFDNNIFAKCDNKDILKHLLII